VEGHGGRDTNPFTNRMYEEMFETQRKNLSQFEG
jgi:hypothetical protein